MKLFIRLVDGEPVEHPILEENIREIFPMFDISNLPEKLAIFERIEEPRPGVYEIVEHTGYKWDGNVVKDSWNVRSMTEEEKNKKQEAAKAAWEQNGMSKSWIFDEDSCSFVPPIPYPTDGNFYQWDEDKENWKLVFIPKPLLDE